MKDSEIWIWINSQIHHFFSSLSNNFVALIDFICYLININLFYIIINNFINTVINNVRAAERRLNAAIANNAMLTVRIMIGAINLFNAYLNYHVRNEEWSGAPSQMFFYTSISIVSGFSLVYSEILENLRDIDLD